MEKSTIAVTGIAGSGAMGSGIAQVAATAGQQVLIFDTNKEALLRSEKNLQVTLTKLVEKGKMSVEQQNAILGRIEFVDDLTAFAKCDLVIEAIVEKLDIKQNLFKQLEGIVSENCLLASNTSSLSIASIAGACRLPERVLGIHFFNPAPLMPLVEIIPGIATQPALAQLCRDTVDAWGKTTVLVKDTPGFIVNRVARPFYSESLRLFDEGIASKATIDWALKEFGGFKMGPFELMDMIGHDVNYVVTETVWTQLYYDPRFRPSLTQKRLLEAGFLGRKSGRGFYHYGPEAVPESPEKNDTLAAYIVNRVLCMLMNEAVDAVYLKVASAADIDLAMTKGVNYPKGLLKWGDEKGWATVMQTLTELRQWYEEERYRCSPLLKTMAASGKTFF